MKKKTSEGGGTVKWCTLRLAICHLSDPRREDIAEERVGEKKQMKRRSTMCIARESEDEKQMRAISCSRKQTGRYGGDWLSKKPQETRRTIRGGPFFYYYQ